MPRAIKFYSASLHSSQWRPGCQKTHQPRLWTQRISVQETTNLLASDDGADMTVVGGTQNTESHASSQSSNLTLNPAAQNDQLQPMSSIRRMFTFDFITYCSLKVRSLLWVCANLCTMIAFAHFIH